MSLSKNKIDIALVILIGIILGLLLYNTDFWQRQKERQMQGEAGLRYLLYLPSGYSYTWERWPLVLFLHGAGNSGYNLEKVKAGGLSKLLKNNDYPFIVVSPQSDEGGWDADALNALLGEIIAQYHVDDQRVYATGFSMGGFGTWAVAEAHPERFAAIAPICGGGNPELAKNLQHVPVWAFHGAKDNVVPISSSEKMIEALKAIGAEVEFTVYPEAAHDAWTATYANPQLYEWLLRHKRYSPKEQGKHDGN